MWAALEQVGLGELVAASPDGIDTVLGEDGSGWSAGQRARLVLARVLLADRPFVLLDEPTAHLDAETEAVLLETLRRLARRATVIVVAHREQWSPRRTTRSGSRTRPGPRARAHGGPDSPTGRAPTSRPRRSRTRRRAGACGPGPFSARSRPPPGSR